MHVMKRVGTAAVLLVACGLLLYGGLRLRHWYAVRHLRDAYASMQRCLYGITTGDGALAATRLRGAQLSAAVQPPRTPWPRRCRAAVAAVRLGVGRRLQQGWQRCDGDRCCDGDAECRDLAQLSQQLAAAAAFVELGQSSLFDAQETTRLAGRVGLAGGTPASAISRAQPAPTTLLTPQQMTPLYRGNYLRLFTDPGGTDGIDLLFYDHQRRYGWCRLALLDAPAAARCRLLSKRIPVGMAGELLPAAAGAPQVLYAQGPQNDTWIEALYGLNDGHRRVTVPARPLGGFVWSNSEYAYVLDEPPLARATVFRMLNNNLDAVASMSGEQPAVGPFVLYDQLVWGEASAAGWYNIKVQPLQRAGQPLGPPQLVGGIAAPGAKLGFDLCRTDTSLALLTAHLRGDVVAGMLSFGGTAGGWRAPLPVLIGSRWFGFTCRRDTATFSWVVPRHERPLDGFIGDMMAGYSAPVTGFYEVHRLRCSALGCEPRSVRIPLRRYAKASRYVVGDVGDSMVLLWRSPLGDVRMRLAPLDELAAAPEVVLFDDVEHGGFGWDLEREPMFGRADQALLLVSRQQRDSEESETFGILIDDHGLVTPLPVTAAAP